MAISPNPFSVQTGQSIELTSTINNAFWSILSGTGSFSTGSNSYKKTFTPSAARSVLIKAQASVWSSFAPLTRDGNDNLTKTDIGQYYYCYTDIYIKNVGDYVEMPIWAGWSTNSRMNITAPYQSLGEIDTNFIYDTNGNNVGSFTPTTGSTIRFEIISGGNLRLSQNGNVLYTFNNPTPPPLYDYPGFRFILLVYAEPAGTVLTKPSFASSVTNIAAESASGTVTIPLAITTNSPLPSATVNTAYSQTITAAGGSGNITFTATGLPAGLSFSTAGVVSGSPTVTGDFTLNVTATDATGATATKSFALTVTAVPVAPPVPSSRWSKSGIVPKAGLEAWNMLDLATDGASVVDFSGKGRDLTASTSLPTLQAMPNLNNQQALYFSGSGSPLKYIGNFNLKHLFIVAAIYTQSFTNYAGLVTGITDSGNDILVGDPGKDTFFNFGYAPVSFRKNDVSFAAANQKAPMNSQFAILEIRNTTGWAMDGLTIMQQRSLANNKAQGWFGELLAYSRILNDAEAKNIYRYLALKFHLWRQSSDLLNIFPFAFDRASTLEEDELAEVSEAEGLRGQDKIYRYLSDEAICAYNLQFAKRPTTEFDASRTFLRQHRLHLPFWIEDCEKNDKRKVTRISKFSDTSSGFISQDYGFNVRDY